MTKFEYLIIGGGMTAAAAVEGIRSVDREGSIGLFSAEPYPPYNRPPLSKGLWRGKPLEKIWREVQPRQVECFLETKVVAVHPDRKQVLDQRGNAYRYEKLLIATGGSPRRLPFGGDEIIYFRTLGNYLRLRELASQGGRFAVIGGGFIGSEIAAALRIQGQEVVMLFPEPGIGARIFPADLSDYVTGMYREKGVEVLSGRKVRDIRRQPEGYRIEMDGGQAVHAVHVVAGLGIRPNLDLAQQAGIQVEDGILVDETLRTSQVDIYAAGDVASFFNPALGKRLRVEHEENANRMGKIAGQNMAGERIAYDHLPAFYSDLFDLGYEAIGETNPDQEVVAAWQEPYRKGMLYYLQAGRVRGVLLWNVWGQIEAARELIGQPLSLQASGKTSTGIAVT